MGIVGNVILNSGGGGGITTNAEVLTSNKAITESDSYIQLLDTNNTSRDITLPDTPAAGTSFLIVNTTAVSGPGAAATLDILIGTDTTEMFKIHCGSAMHFVYANSEWTCFGNGISVKRTGANTFEPKTGVSIGSNATVYGAGGIAIGDGALGYNGGVAVGASTVSSGGGSVAIGSSGIANIYSIGITAGDRTADKANYIAMGRTSSNAASDQVSMGIFTRPSNRTRSFSKGIFSTHNISTTIALAEEVGMAVATTNATTTVMGTTCYMAANSVVQFEVSVVARQATTQDCKAWRIFGAMKRDGSNNTSLIGSTVIDSVEDAGATAWTADVVANDTSDRLDVEVTGEASKTISWTAVVRITERR